MTHHSETSHGDIFSSSKVENSVVRNAKFNGTEKQKKLCSGVIITFLGSRKVLFSVSASRDTLKCVNAFSPTGFKW